MASKFGLAGGIPERRVRPIWDAVDSRQFKAALKLCAALITKYPSSPYALALKALIMERMGKLDEALNICLNANELLFSNNVHIDDLALNTLQIVFQRLDRLDLATSCYEHACGKYPNNLEIMMGLFNCYVREYSFVKQQQTSIKMYKIVTEERFLLWAICSIQLQVFSSSGGEKLLPLAEALLKKHVGLHSLHEPDALVIYVSILEQQAKYGAALEVLSGNLGSLIGIEVDKLRMQGRLLARACDYAAASETFQKVLESCPDDWESFLHYLNCLLEVDVNWSKACTTQQISSLNYVDLQTCKPTNLSDEAFESRILSALSFIQKLQMEVHNDYVRCPYLACIEIERRRHLKGMDDEGKLMGALLNYFYRFSHLSCFTSDVEMFLCILTVDEKDYFLEKIVKISESSSMTPIKALGQVITIMKIQELFGIMFTNSVGEAETSASRMAELFCKNLTLSRDLDLQENMHGEELLCLACNVLVQLFWRTKCIGYLLEAILILEFGLTIRRYVWQYKILLLHLYSQLQALPLALERYYSLEIKNILMETFSHHILPQMLRSPLILETTDLLNEYLKFMDDHFREAADLTFLAYRHRNYSKVIDFVQFKEHLQHSNQYLMAKVEASITQLKQKDILEDVEPIIESLNYGLQLLELSNEEKLRSLTFNEDLQARPWWSPSSDVNYLSEPFEEGSLCLRENLYKPQAGDKADIVKKIIKRKSLLPRLLSLAIRAASSSAKENIEPNGSESDSNNSSELKSLLERYVANADLQFDDAVQVITRISEGQKSFKDYDSDLMYWINFAVFVNAWNLSSHYPGLHTGDDSGSNSWRIVNSLVENSVSELLRSAKPILTNPESNFPDLVEIVTESISWHSLVIQSRLRSLLPSSKKKKRVCASDQYNSPQLREIRGSIQCLVDALKSVLKWVSGQIGRSEDECVDVLLSYLRVDGDGGPGRVLRSLEQTDSTDPELGERISGALQSWSSASVVRKMVGAQRTMLLEFYSTCESKLKLLDSLKQSV